MDTKCYECGQQNQIAGYITTISPITLSDSPVWNLDKLAKQYLKYIKITTESKLDIPKDITNYHVICTKCELDFILSRRSLLKKFKKCDKCSCYSELDGKITNLIDDNYKLSIEDKYCFFKYDKFNDNNLNLCIECCMEIMKTNEKTSLTNCKKCNKKIGKPKCDFYPCNNVIFITNKIFVIDTIDFEKYLSYMNNIKKSKLMTDKLSNNGQDEDEDEDEDEYEYEEIEEFKALITNGLIGLYNYDDIESNMMINDIEFEYLFENFDVKILYKYLLHESKIEQNPGDQICVNCINEIGYTSCEGKINCGTCNKVFKRILNCKNQGYNCSCGVFDNFIRGYYGSNYDYSRVNFTNGKPNYIKFLSTICDDCVTNLIKEGICCEQIDE